MLFLVVGAASAASVDDVSIKEDSNLDDSVSALSSQLESSNEVSISETNLVNSQNDNLGNSSALAAANPEENDGDLQASNKEVNNNTLSSNNGADVQKSSDKQVVSASNTKVPVKMTVVSAVSDDTSTIFKVKLTDSENGATLSDRKVNIIVQGKNLVGTTGSDGIAQITAQALDKGTYTFTLKFSGTASRYAATTVTQKVAVTKVSKVPVKLAVVSAMTDEVGSTFNVKLSDRQTGEVLPNRKVNIVLQGKNLVGTTDENGIAQINAQPLKGGDYAVTLKFSGTISRYAAASVTHKVTVTEKVPVKMTIVSATSTKSASLFKIKVTDGENGKAVAGRKVNIIVEGKNLVGTTDNNGIAQISAKPLSNGAHEVTLKFSGTISRYAHATVKQDAYINGFVPVKMTVISAISDDSATIFQVKVTDGENGKAVANRKVNIIVQGKNLVGTTDKDGVAEITAKPLAKGTYDITLKFSGTTSRYTATTSSQKVSVFKKIPVKMTVTDVKSTKTATIFKVKVTDSENGKAVDGRKVNIIVQGKNLVGTTDKNGVAQITAQHLSDGIYSVTLKFSGTISRYSATTTTQYVGVGITKVSLNSVISASRTVKSYVENYGKLPSSVKINGISFTSAQYLYLASEAIYNLKSGDLSYLTVKLVNDPKSPAKTTYLGNLYNYYPVAKSLVDYGNKNNMMPNSVSSNIGTIGYDGAVYAVSRVLTFYGDESQMPNYVTIKTLYDAPSPSGINPKNTISDLTAYLAASKNCQVDNAQIKQLVSKLTSGLTSDSAKARAIYNYVRDSIAYSFYYDTRHGAVGTLNAKSGNCVDQAHLLVAMYRTADLPARYVHGTCYFTLSGNTYGHVWTQVLIGDTWTVGDPTSNRNSFGNVVNWNTNSYKLNGYYASLPF